MDAADLALFRIGPATAREQALLDHIETLQEKILEQKNQILFLEEELVG